MSDYQNSDTAKWDADQVRRQTGETQKAAKGKKKRRFGWLIYLACVIVGSCLLAGLGWLAVNDVCALNKAPLTATIEVESGDSGGKGGYQAEESRAHRLQAAVYDHQSGVPCQPLYSARRV